MVVGHPFSDTKKKPSEKNFIYHQNCLKLPRIKRLNFQEPFTGKVFLYIVQQSDGRQKDRSTAWQAGLGDHILQAIGGIKCPERTCGQYAGNLMPQDTCTRLGKGFRVAGTRIGGVCDPPPPPPMLCQIFLGARGEATAVAL